MMGLSRKTIRTAAISFAGAALLGSGCVSYTKETTERQVPVPVAAATPAPADRVVTYPEGRYQLYGDGTRVPYYWVWVPSGSSTARRWLRWKATSPSMARRRRPTGASR